MALCCVDVVLSVVTININIDISTLGQQKTSLQKQKHGVNTPTIHNTVLYFISLFSPFDGVILVCTKYIYTYIGSIYKCAFIYDN